MPLLRLREYSKIGQITRAELIIRKEDRKIMVEVTEEATKQIQEYFKDKEVSPIRIFLNAGGWGGPSLAMALDEPKDNDQVFDVNGFQFLMEKDFYDKAQPVKVDFLGYGFKIDSNIEFDASNSACGSCSTSGGCGE